MKKEENKQTNIINADFSDIVEKVSTKEANEVEEVHEDPKDPKDDGQIFEAKDFVDKMGRKVKAIIPLDESDVADFSKAEFHGSFYVDSPAGAIPLVIEFPLGFKLEQCFEKFDEQAEIRVKRLEDEMEERSRIVTPGQLGNPNGPFTP